MGSKRPQSTDCIGVPGQAGDESSAGLLFNASSFFLNTSLVGGKEATRAALGDYPQHGSQTTRLNDFIN